MLHYYYLSDIIQISMITPVIYNFPDHYRNDGLRAFTLTLKYDDGTPVDLTGASVKMDLMDGSRKGFGFSDLDGTITLLPGGVVQFNKINSWTILTGRYDYDLQVTDSIGFITTFLKGKWTVITDITK